MRGGTVTCTPNCTPETCPAPQAHDLEGQARLEPVLLAYDGCDQLDWGCWHWAFRPPSCPCDAPECPDVHESACPACLGEDVGGLPDESAHLLTSPLATLKVRFDAWEADWRARGEAEIRARTWMEVGAHMDQADDVERTRLFRSESSFGSGCKIPAWPASLDAARLRRVRGSWNFRKERRQKDEGPIPEKGRADLRQSRLRFR